MVEAEGAGGGGAAAGGAGRGRGVNDALLAGFMGDVLALPCWLSLRTAAAQAKGDRKTSADEAETPRCCLPARRRPARRRGAGPRRSTVL